MFAAFVVTPSLFAAPPTPQPAKDKKKPAQNEAEKKADQEEPKGKKEEPKDRYFAITHATVHTLTRGELKDVTILSKNGKVLRMGRDLKLPEDEDLETLDVSGFQVYPGLIAVSAGNTLGGKSPDDTTNVYALQTVLALAGGITTAVAGNTAAKLTYGTTDDMIVKRDLFLSLKYDTRAPDARRKLRIELDKARQYLRDWDAFQEAQKTDPEAKKPDDLKGAAAKYLKLIKHEAVAVAEANTAHDLIDLCDLSRRYGFKMVIRGAVEGWTVAPRMARAGFSAMITPRRTVPADDRLNRPNGSSIENAVTLYNHGVPVAVIPQIGSITTWGLAGRDLLHLNMEAAFAVRGGLPEEAAIRAITIDAARILGIDHRVGSIEVGKDADFVITDGDLLHYMTHVRWTIVNGRIAYDKAKDTLFNHIRPQGDRNAPPPDDYWPRRLGATD